MLVGLGTAGAALLVALLSLALGLANAIFAFIYWRRSGPLVRVTSAFAFPVFGAELGDQHVSVEAFNRGRAPVTIEGWGLRYSPSDSDLVVTAPPPWMPALPYRLEPGASATWYVDLEDVRRILNEHPDARPRAWVRLAGGKRVFAPAPVKLS